MDQWFLAKMTDGVGHSRDVSELQLGDRDPGGGQPGLLEEDLKFNQGLWVPLIDNHIEGGGHADGLLLEFHAK